MTSHNHNSLTTYQRAILTHLGIVPWRLKSSATEIADTQTAVNPVQTTNTLDLIKPSQEQRAASLEKLKKVVTASSKQEKQATSIPDQVLILTNQNEKNSQFIKDVLQAAGLDTKQVCYTQASQKQAFKDYRFLWSILDIANQETNNILAEITDNSLITIRIDSENAVATKKQLWQILQNQTIPA